MRRTLLLLLAAAALLAGFAGWRAVADERRFTQLAARGDAALASSDTVGAIEAWSGAIALRPRAMVAWLKRGITYRERGELAPALRDLRRAVALDRAAPRAREELGDVHAALDHFPQAVEQYEACLAIDDRVPRVHYKLALARLRARQPDLAEASLRRALALQDVFPEAHYLLGLSLLDRGRRDAAARELSRALAQDPALLPAREELFDLERELGHLSAALRHLEALAAIDGDRPERHVALALAYADQGRTDAAVSTLVRANSRFPDRPDILVALGRVWLAEARETHEPTALAKAAEALGRSAEHDGGSEALAVLGRVLLLQGRHAAAFDVLERASSRFPLATDALEGLADAAERLHRDGAARDALARLVALEEDDAGPATVARHLTRLARIETRLGDARAALRTLARAAAAEPGRPAIAAMLAHAQRSAGQRVEAIETVGRALAEHPNDPVLLRLRRDLR